MRGTQKTIFSQQSYYYFYFLCENVQSCRMHVKGKVTMESLCPSVFLLINSVHNLNIQAENSACAAIIENCVRRRSATYHQDKHVIKPVNTIAVGAPRNKVMAVSTVMRPANAAAMERFSLLTATNLKKCFRARISSSAA